MHKVVGIIAPSGDELAPIEKSMGAVVRTCRAGLEFLSGMLNGVKCVAVLSGVCKVNAAIAAQVLIDIYAVDAIIVCGVAGGMDRRLKIGDTAIATEIAYHDVDDAILRDYHPFMKVPRFYADEHMVLLMREAVDAHEFEQPVYFGVVVTGEAFIETNGRAEINDRFKPLCVDMKRRRQRMFAMRTRNRLQRYGRFRMSRTIRVWRRSSKTAPWLPSARRAC